MKFLSAAVLALTALASGSVVTSPKDGTFELLILHNNDMHARFEQTSQMSGVCTPEDREAGKCYGGFPRVAHVVKEARRAAAAGEGPPVLYLNAGDTYTGSAWFTLFKWKIAAEFINALQPDAVSLSRNDIYKGGKLSPFLEHISADIVSSNIFINDAAIAKKLQRSMMFVMDGVKVGVVGFLTPPDNILDSNGNVEFVNEVLALREEVATLKSLNVNIIIALGHSSLETVIDIAKEVEGIDLVISGNNNKFYWDGNIKKVVNNNKTTIVTQQTGKRVPIIMSTAYDKYLGSIKVKFDSDGELINYDAEPVLLNSSVQDVQAIQIVQKYHSEIVSKSEEVIGNTAVVLDGDTCNFEECNLGNLITDATMYYYATRFEGDNWTNAAVAVIHGGAIARSIAPSNRPAAVTRGELLSVLPLESHISLVTMNGEVLIKFLEHSVANFSQRNPTGQFLQFSGVRVVYDMSKEPGSRVTSAVVRCWSCTVPIFYEIDDWRTYRLLMPTALADGQFGYSMLVGLPREDLEYDEVTCLEDYIKLRSPVYPEVAGRIVLNNVVAEPVPDSASTVSCTALFLSLIPLFVYRF